MFFKFQAGTHNSSSLLDKDEQERGESIAEFSIGNARRDWSAAVGRSCEFSTVGCENYFRMKLKMILKQRN